MAKLPGRQGEIEMSEMGVACRVQLVEYIEPERSSNLRRKTLRVLSFAVPTKGTVPPKIKKRSSVRAMRTMATAMEELTGR